MKGVIVEIRNDYAAVLSDNGSINKIKNNNYQIGEEIQMINTTKKSKKKIYALAASVAATILIAGTGVYAYAAPYSYVSLDVNPSIEYKVNRFDRVIEASNVNEDGADILINIDVKNKTIDDAIKDTITEINEKGYFKEGETGGVVIATSNDDSAKAEELASDLKATAEDVIADKSITADVEVLSVGKERVLEAKKLGVTPGKLNLVEKLQKSAANPEDISIEEWLKKPVKEIMKATKANKEQEKNKTENANTNSDSNAVENKSTNANPNAAENKSINSNPNANPKANPKSNVNEEVNSNENVDSSSSEVKENNSNEVTDNNSNTAKQSNPSAEKSNKNK
ncbi:MAG TPA: anti-sigma factor domain-containing protein [Clostridium sp.]